MKILNDEKQMAEIIAEQRAFEVKVAKHLCEENPKLGFSQALAQAEKFTRPKE